MARHVVPVPRSGEEPPAAADEALRVLVAVDGSSASVRALVWGLEFAASCGGVVEVVTAWPLHAPVHVGEAPGHFSHARWQAVAAQRSAIEQAASILDGAVPEATSVLNGSARDVLVQSAEGAALLVVGTRRAFPADDEARPTLAEALQEAVRCPVLEVSALGAVSLPWGDRAFART